MAKQSPFVYGEEDRSMLDSFAKRVGIGIGVKELRIALNGWVAQMLLHNCSRHKEFLDSDLDEYVAGRGYRLEGDGTLIRAARGRIARSVQDSTPLCAEYVPGFGGWRLMAAFDDIPAPTAGLAALGSEARNARKLGTDFAFSANSVTDRGTEWRCQIPSWKSTPAQGQALIDAFLAAGMDKMTGEQAERVKNPVGWFAKRLRDAGVPIAMFKYMGTVETLWDTNNAPVNYGLGPVYRGCTKLIGPSDLSGARPVWVGPKLGDISVWVCDNFHSLGGLSHTVTNITCTWKTWKSTATKTNVTKAAAIAACPDSGFTVAFAKTSAYWSCVDHAESQIWTTDASVGLSVVDFPYGVDLASVLPFASLTWVPVKSQAAESSTVRYVSNKWYVTKPNGFVNWITSSAVVSNIGTEAGGYGIDTWAISPSYVMFRVTMAMIREYLIQQHARTDLDPTDKLKLSKAITKSADYADAVVSTTVTTTLTPPARVVDVQSLRMVQEAKKGDVDLMTEPLGDGDITLGTLAKRLEGDRTKGRKYQTYASVVDEAVAIEQIISSRIASTLPVANQWNLQIVLEPMTGVYEGRGSFGGTIVEALSPMEVAILWMYGAYSTDGSTSDSAIADQLAMGANWRTELSSLGAADLIGDGSGRAAWGEQSRSWDKFSPSAFCDVAGYPVVGFTDKDTLVRQQLLFKAQESDPADLACAMFFANQLSFVASTA